MTSSPLPPPLLPTPSLARRFAASMSLFRCARAFFDGLARTEPSPRQRTQAVAGTTTSREILVGLHDGVWACSDEDDMANDDEGVEMERRLLSPTRGDPLLLLMYL